MCIRKYVHGIFQNAGIHFSFRILLKENGLETVFILDLGGIGDISGYHDYSSIARLFTRERGSIGVFYNPQVDFMVSSQPLFLAFVHSVAW